MAKHTGHTQNMVITYRKYFQKELIVFVYWVIVVYTNAAFNTVRFLVFACLVEYSVLRHKRLCLGGSADAGCIHVHDLFLKSCLPRVKSLKSHRQHLSDLYASVVTLIAAPTFGAVAAEVVYDRRNSPEVIVFGYHVRTGGPLPQGVTVRLRLADSHPLVCISGSGGESLTKKHSQEKNCQCR